MKRSAGSNAGLGIDGQVSRRKGAARTGRASRRGVARSGVIVVVLLALALVAAGCGPLADKDTTTLSTTATTGPATTAGQTTTSQTATTDRFPAKVTAQGLAYKSDGTGSISEFLVEIERQPQKKVAVGVREGEVFGTGDRWRASAWTAPLVATDILNLDLADFAIDYEVSGQVDGASIGALMTIATLAAFLGDELNPEVSMTGTINPDYTIGPVGGIPQKLEAAAGAGKKTVLVPLGQRYDVDLKTGQTVDLVEKGNQLGLTVKEVADVFEAYPQFTGKDIPRKTGGGGLPSISPAAEQKLKELAEANVNETLNALELYQEQSAEAQQATIDYAYAAEDALNQASNYLRQGSIGAAYGYTQVAMAMANQAHLRALAYGFYDWNELALRLKAVSPEKRLSDLSTKLVATTPQTVGEAACVMNAWGLLTTARVAVEQGTESLDQIANNYSSLDEDTLSMYMGGAISKYVLTEVYRLAAEDSLKLAQVAKGDPVASPERVDQMSEGYRRAAEANLALLDSIVVGRIAREWGISEENARYFLLMTDQYFFQARATINKIQSLLSELPDGVARDYAVLGASFAAFSSSAASMAINHTYGAQYDFEGNITGFSQDRSLSRALDLARANAEASLLQIDSASGATVVPWLSYEYGNIFREGAPEDKVSALHDYWTAHVQARTVLGLAGKLEPLVK